MLARSAPSFPLWRMRSKHALDVVDEKLWLLLCRKQRMFHNYNLSENAARVAHKRAYGRIAKLREIAEKKRFDRIAMFVKLLKFRIIARYDESGEK